MTRGPGYVFGRSMPPRFICKVALARHDGPPLDRKTVAFLGVVRETPRTLDRFLELERHPATFHPVVDVVHQSLDKRPRPLPDELVATDWLVQFR
jgi:hypothetical protein